MPPPTDMLALMIRKNAPPLAWLSVIGQLMATAICCCTRLIAPASLPLEFENRLRVLPSGLMTRQLLTGVPPLLRMSMVRQEKLPPSVIARLFASVTEPVCHEATSALVGTMPVAQSVVWFMVAVLAFMYVTADAVIGRAIANPARAARSWGARRLRMVVYLDFMELRGCLDCDWRWFGGDTGIGVGMQQEGSNLSDLSDLSDGSDVSRWVGWVVLGEHADVR